MRGHGNKPRNASPGGREGLSTWRMQWLDAAGVERAQEASKRRAAEQKELVSKPANAGARAGV